MSDMEQSDREFEDFINSNPSGDRQMDLFMLVGMKEKNRFIAEMHRQTVDALKAANEGTWNKDVIDDLQAFLGKIMGTTEKTLDQFDIFLMSQIPDEDDDEDQEPEDL